MIQTQPLEVNDFSGGITDFYVNGRPNQAQVADNVVILNNRSLLMRSGSVVDDTLNDLIPSGTNRIGDLINFNFNSHLLVQSEKEIFYRNPSAYTTLAGPTGNDAFNVGTDADHISYAQWHGHVFLTNLAFANPIKIWEDTVVRLAQAGLPALASSPVVTPTVVGARSYLYSFLHKYTYTVGSEVFIDRGPTTLVAVPNSGDPSVNQNNITAIPVLANGGTGNYDTAVIEIEIYRTVDGGDTFYRIGAVTNGTTIFTDNFSDATIQNNELLYTTGGVLENDPPPLSKYVHIVNAIGYWAHIKDGTEVLKHQFLQSIPGDPDSVPADNIGEVEEEITGFSSIQSIPIVMCVRFIYRVEGTFDEQGRGFISPIRISDTAGCISNRSIVQAENMLFWAGNDGFYMTDGYKVLKITEHLIDAYKNIIASTTDPTRIVGTYDEKNRRVIWAVETDSSSIENDSCWVLDLQNGITKESVFTTFSGTEDDFRPTALTFFNKLLHRGDSRGYVFRHSDEITTDPKVNTLVSAADWYKKTIIWDYTSIATNFGSSFLRKWVPKILVTMKNKSNISVQVNAINDDGKLIRNCKEIRYRNNCVWGDPEFSWGNPLFVWNAEGLIEQWRWLPAKGLRISYLQIQVTNAYTIITNSDTLGTATVNNTLKTVTLDDAVSYDWPVDSVDYFISFAEDNYMREFLITARTANVLTFSDSGNNSTNGSKAWLLKGFRKEEVLNLLQITPHFALLSKTQTTFETGDSGGNA